MTVAELRKALAEYPNDARVVVRGYEGGYCDAMVGAGAVVFHNPPNAGRYYYGPHEPIGDDFWDGGRNATHPEGDADVVVVVDDFDDRNGTIDEPFLEWSTAVVRARLYNKGGGR